MREAVKRWNRTYYLKNRETILGKYKVEARCPKCHKIVLKHNLKRHRETIKCSNFTQNS